MAQKDYQVGANFLESFIAAFNAHDIEAVMLHMTQDCNFEASAGTAFNGEQSTGQKEVRDAIETVFTNFPDARWSNPKHFVSGNRGFSEWIFTGTRLDGTRVEVAGCDLFTFEDGKISDKNSFRKNRLVDMSITLLHHIQMS